MLIRFSRTDGRPVVVNSEFVRSLEPYGDESATLIYFGKDDFLLVEGRLEAVKAALEA